MGSFLKSFFKSLIWSFLFFTLVYFAYWGTRPANFPITQVKFSGQRKHLSEEELRECTFSEVRAGFFRLKVSTLQQQLLSLPWVKQVDIRKEWPDKLVINFTEHTPAALWNNQNLLSETGTLFKPNQSLKAFETLPQLQGPDGRYSLVWQQFLAMNKILQPLGLSIKGMILAPRGAWQLQLSNGITVMLGTNDILDRLQRFVDIYQKELLTETQKVAYVDLRYTRGMAIGWKSA